MAEPVAPPPDPSGSSTQVSEGEAAPQIDATKPLSGRLDRALRILLLTACSVMVVRGGWIVEDAYITFRSVDNLLNGFGPRWNTVERVQAFTHPLWMLVLTAASGLTRELFFTTIFVQFGLSIVALAILLFRLCRGTSQALLVTVAAILSKSFIEWSTSGLENPLSHLLALTFCLVYLRDTTERRPLRLSLLAALCMVNRLDSGLVVLPALMAEALPAIRAAREKRSQQGLWHLLLGQVPLVAWEGFSLFYYGSLVPNTAHAKLSTGLPRLRLLQQGLYFVYNSLSLDPVTITFIVLATGLTLVARRRGALLAIGVLLELGYDVYVGGDFMSGRFFSLPFAASLALAADFELPNRNGITRSDGAANGPKPRGAFGSPAQLRALVLRALVAGAPIAFVLLLGSLGHFPTLSDAYWSVAPMNDAHGIGDYFRGSIPHSTLRSMTREKHLPEHGWIQEGLNLKNGWTPRSVPPVWGGVGYAGYYAGPEVYIVDKYALTEPLLARLPMPDAEHVTRFRIGHFDRDLPEGYLESVTQGRNLIKDPNLARYYEDIRLVTRAPLFQPARLAAVLRLSLGLDNHYLRQYLREYHKKRTTLSELPPARPTNPREDSSTYAWFSPSTPVGVAFTDTGLTVAVEGTKKATALNIGLSTGDYTLTFSKGRREVASMNVNGVGQTAEISVPLSAAQEGFDRITVMPKAHGFARLTYLKLRQ